MMAKYTYFCGNSFQRPFGAFERACSSVNFPPTKILATFSNKFGIEEGGPWRRASDGEDWLRISSSSRRRQGLLKATDVTKII